MSPGNTTDTDILEYILTKLTVGIVAKSRTFLVKVKTHRGESLNEGPDDRVEEDRKLERDGAQWKKDTWSKTIRNSARTGEEESLMEERLLLIRHYIPHILFTLLQ